MLKILAALVLGIAMLLPAAAAFAEDEGIGDRGYSVQTEINSAPAEPAVTFQVDNSRE